MAKKGYGTFKGGIHPPYDKEISSGKAIEPAPVPRAVAIPLKQHIGAANQPLVSPGDRVAPGQIIGDTEAFVSAPVHSSVAGTVRSVEEVRTFSGETVESVVIDVDAEQPEYRGSPSKPFDSLTPEDIRRIARDAGLVGMGGATFPTHVKVSPPKGRKIDYVMINGCECEPYLTCDHRVMLEKPADVVAGLKLLMKVSEADMGYIGVEANKMDAVEALRAEIAGDRNILVEVLDVKYPEGAEKQLISAITGRRVPPGALPFEVGCLVQNVQTAVALYESASTGKPLYERVLTVTGRGIAEPKNLLVRVGTPISALVECCGGLTDTARLVLGGPMTGWAQPDDSAPVIKGTSGVVALTAEALDVGEERDCVRCAKCVDACPLYLMPNYIVEATKDQEWEKAELWGALDCYECGCCSYVCPAYIPHVDYARKAKAAIAAAKG